MKILHIGYSDSKGGAAVAMMRIHNSLLKQKIDSHVLVSEKLLDEQNIHSFNENFFDQKISEFKIKLIRQKKYIFKQADKTYKRMNSKVCACCYGEFNIIPFKKIKRSRDSKNKFKP